MFTGNSAAGRQPGGIALAAIAAALMLFNAGARAETGLYFGGSVGQSAIDIPVADQVQTLAFDEEDFAWKAYGGFNFGLIVLDLAVEAGYVDFGGPSGDVLGSQVEVDANGFSAFGVIGQNFGPLGVFAKVGMISWDADVSVDSFRSSSDGTDPAYGIGAKFGLASLDVRAEYEIFDIDDAEDLTMISVGLVWSF